MKAKTITIILLCSFFISNAQNYEYVRFVNEGFIWSYCDVVKVGVNEYNLNYSQLEFYGDTIINDISYKKLFKHDCLTNRQLYIASMREENKKVYAIYSEKQIEQLIYNFSLVVGDSIQSPYDETQYFQVTKIDTIEISSGKRMRIELNFDTWIEGIGTLDRFMMYPLHALSLYELGIRINYQKQGTEFIYKTNEWYLNENECNISLIKPTEANKTIVYFFSPELLKIETELSCQSCTFELLDLNGRLLLQKELDLKNNTINVSQFSKGLYVYRLSLNREVDITGIIIKN